MALFATNAGPQTNNLVEFGAGKMVLRGKTVQADPRKGTLFIYQSNDGLMHFCWKDANSGSVEDDLIIFPDDAEFKPVKQCSTGRVFLLSFKNQSRKMFFWMQAFVSDRDEEYCKKVNELLNNPPVPATTRLGRASGPGGDDNQMSMVNQLLNMGGGGVSGDDIHNALAGVDRRQMMQLLNLMGAGSGANLADVLGGGAEHTASSLRFQPSSQLATPTATGDNATAAVADGPPAGEASTTGSSNAAGATPTPVAPPQQQPIISAADFGKILANLGMATDIGTSRADVDLENVLVSKNVEPVLVGNEKNIDRLVPFLPSESPAVADRQEVVKTLQTPQFRQAVEGFGEALKSGQLGPFMQQFGFSSDVINAFKQGDVQSVAEMLEKESKNNDEAIGSPSTNNPDKSDKSEEKAEAKPKKDEEENTNEQMDLD